MLSLLTCSLCATLCFLVLLFVRETESQRVEAQVAAMEARLAMMKVALTAEKQKMDQTAQKDGSRWKSGSVNAGSLTGYARDVQNRGRRKKRTKSGARGPSGRSRYTKQNFSNRGGKGPSARSGGGGAAQKTPRGGRENAEQWSPQEVSIYYGNLSSLRVLRLLT